MEYLRPSPVPVPTLKRKVDLQIHSNPTLEPLFRDQNGQETTFPLPLNLAVGALRLVEEDKIVWPSLLNKGIDQLPARPLSTIGLHNLPQEKYNSLIYEISQEIYGSLNHVSGFYGQKKYQQAFNSLRNLAIYVSPFRRQQYAIFDASSLILIRDNGLSVSDPLFPGSSLLQTQFRNRPYSMAINNALLRTKFLSSKDVNQFPGQVRHELGFLVNDLLDNLDLLSVNEETVSSLLKNIPQLSFKYK